jgi:glycosyltransferase involved in cell wall biosynthesis
LDTALFYDDEVERVVAREFDRAFYLETDQDGQDLFALDPVSHYCRIGWRERRNPTAWFDTAYYLAVNQDIAVAGINPFWHYIVAGREEGRKPQRQIGARLTAIETAMDPDTRTRDWGPRECREVLSVGQLGTVVAAALAPARGLVVSLSHDLYFRQTGGIQLMIGEEQRCFGRQGMVYLHISPFRPLLRLADSGSVLVNVAIDGELAGVASYGDIAAALAGNAPKSGELRLLVVHCLLGHHVPGIIQLHHALHSTDDVFWLHDYSSLCVGYTLLRNDVAFCNAPPQSSMSCRLCVYGGHRASHTAQIEALFDAVPFHVVAPSQAALDVWSRRSVLPHRSARVHVHAKLVAADAEPVRRPPSGPVRVAFIGYPSAHKGWPVLVEITMRTFGQGVYEIMQVGSAPSRDPAATNIVHHFAQTSCDDPDAMIEALARLAVDLVVAPAPWPETFSYVAHEALAAGADVVCLQDSGAIVDLVLREGRGVVAADEAALVDFFVSGRAADYVRRCRMQGTGALRLQREGTTATLELPGG